MVQAMSNCATEPSAARTSRDLRALAWTVSSLADDTELEPFVEGIPDVLWGPTERRYSYDEHIQRLMRDPHLQLLLRVEGLLRSCDTGLLSPEAFTRRQITCYKALWAIASLQNPGSSLSHQPLNFRFDYPRRIHRAHIGQYSISAWALMDWNVFCSMLGRLAELSTYLAVCEAEYHNGGHTPNLQPVTSYLESAMESLNISLSETPEIMHYILYGVAEPTVSPLRLIAGLSRVLVILRTTTPHRILFRYLERCAELESPPYRWKDTRARISLDNTAQFSAFKDILERTLERVIVGGGLDRLNDVKTSGWMDTIVQELYASWMPDQTSEPTALPTGIIHYLINRTSDTALSQFVSNHHLEMRSAFPITLSATRPVIDPYGREIKIDETLAALWRILSLPLRIPTFNMEKPWSIFDAILEKVIDSGRSNSSVIAMVKTKILDNLGWWIEEFPHSVLCTETAHARASEFREEEGYVLRNHIIETSVALLAEFLEDCNSTLVLYKAAETIRHIGASAVPRAEIHASHQVRLANGMHRAANVDKPDVDLIDAVISCRMFDLYTQPGPSESHPWLDDPIARSQIQDALSAYANSSPIISPISLRAQAIIEGLDRLHGKGEIICENYAGDQSGRRWGDKKWKTSASWLWLESNELIPLSDSDKDLLGIQNAHARRALPSLSRVYGIAECFRENGCAPSATKPFLAVSSPGFMNEFSDGVIKGGKQCVMGWARVERVPSAGKSSD
ncbi:hypothetical protein B0H17DRAFT_1174282 [Mycena rosella]|uniref:Uncharacterized protein n=1 Tax=Mycena rosella TaxID=1033263 RepID=A0AAD7GYN6_MYCRO|nr:hypothetical protein B0H17DRAFT_1174282 [Mycena rosella]